jgi:hypothetical protein
MNDVNRVLLIVSYICGSIDCVTLLLVYFFYVSSDIVADKDEDLCKQLECILKQI